MSKKIRCSKSRCRGKGAQSAGPITCWKTRRGTRGQRDATSNYCGTSTRSFNRRKKRGGKKLPTVYLHVQIRKWLNEKCTELDRQSQISTHPLNEVHDERTNKKKR